MPVPGQAGRQPESQAVHVSETRAMISMESHSRGSAAPAYCVSYTLRLLQRQHKPTVVTRPPSVAFPPGVWPTFINHSPGGPPTSFGRHNLWELRDSASPPPRSLVWLCNLAGRLSRTRRFSSLHPLNVIKLKRNCSQDSISSALLSLGPCNEGFADGPSGRRAQRSTAAGIPGTVTNEEGANRGCANKQLYACESSLKTSALSLPLCFHSLPPQQKIKFAMDMSWWKEFKWYFE